MALFFPSFEAPPLDESGKPTLGTFRASDGYVSYVRRFSPLQKPIGRLICIHGIQSHGGWYARSSARFSEAGFDVYFLDRRGAGWNSAHRGDAPSFRRLLDDIGELVQALPQDGLPNFLLGISWGGKLAVGLQYRHPGLVSGMVLVCPGLIAKVSPSLVQRFLIGRARLRAPTKRFPIPLSDPTLFTASPEGQRFISEDRWSLREATARFLFNSATLDIYLRRAKKRVHLPVLLLLAEHDRILNNDAVRKLMERFPSPDKTVLEYPGSHHTLEFEPPNHPWVADVVQWLERKVRVPRSSVHG